MDYVEPTVEEMKELGLFPSEDTVTAARDGIKAAKLAEAESRAQSLRDQLANAEAELAALQPVVETPAEEVTEVQG